ncbi:MAG: hypothetical protein ACFB4I_10125 [Cyanophyceae cyanobacterium]
MMKPPSQSPTEAEFVVSHFISLLADAITFCHLAENPSLTRSARASLVRASILNSVFALECVANILLKSIDLSKHIYLRFEKLPILEKYEAILFLLFPAHNFNRGAKEVQEIKELIALRNAQVHVKVRHEEAVGKSINEAWWAFEPKDNSKTKVLKVPKNSDRWDSSYGVMALQSLDTFLKLFLIDWAHFSPYDVSNTLLYQVQFGNKEAILMPEDSISALDLAKKHMGLKLDFMDLDIPNVRVSFIDKDVSKSLCAKVKIVHSSKFRLSTPCLTMA